MSNSNDTSRDTFMQRALKLADQSILKGGGPFGAVIVKDGRVVGEGANRVTLDNDPTAHAEIVAIRKAAGKLGKFDLSGCEIYCTCEPCPMCLGAIYWARINTVYFSADRQAARQAGFDDYTIYNEFALPTSERSLLMVRLLPQATAKIFQRWRDMDNKTPY